MISQSTNSDKQNEILEAALSLFVEFGFHGTPTSKIAAKAGVANGTLFHYYSTKDELVLALYIHIKQQMTGAITAAAENEESLPAKFRSIFINSLVWALYNRTAFQFIQQFHTSPFLSRISPEETQKQVQGHFALIAEGIRTGIIKPLPVELVYSLTMAHIFGLFQYIINNNFSAAQQSTIIDDSCEMLLQMLK